MAQKIPYFTLIIKSTIYMKIRFIWFVNSRLHYTQKKFAIKDIFSKNDKIRSFLRIRSHLLKNP